MPRHTLSTFDAEMAKLSALLYSMFKITRKNLKHSLKALMSGDIEQAQQVIKNDAAVNMLEMQADELARAIMVQYQPTASDMRMVFATIKIVTDLERLSDMAVCIAQNVCDLNGVIPKNLASIPMMQELDLEQLKSVRRAYADSDANLAEAIILRNHLINEEFINTQRIMITHMAEDPSCISQCVALTNIAKVLERVGDHITNIAEMVIYSAKGFDVRHIPAAEMQALLDTEDDE